MNRRAALLSFLVLLAAPAADAGPAAPGGRRAREPGHSEEIALPYPQSRQAITEKGRIHWLESGPEEAPAVVLVHGFPEAAADWRPVLDALDDVFHVYAPDLPGFGSSGRPDFVEYDVAGLAGGLGTFVETVGLASAHFVALDLGVPVVLRYAAEDAKRVASLTLGAGPVVVGRPLPALLGRLDASISGELEAGRLDRELGRYIQAGSASGAAPDEARAAALASSSAGKGGKKALLQWIRSVAPEAFRLADRAAALVDVPVTVVWGEVDPLFPPDGAEAVLKAFPKARVVPLAGVGHFPLIEDPGKLVAALVGVLPRPVVETFVAEIPLVGYQGERLQAKFVLRNDRKRRVRLSLAASAFERVGEPVVLPGRQPVEPAGPEALVLGADKLTLEAGKEAEVTVEVVVDPRRFQFGERYKATVALSHDVKGLEVEPVLLGVRVLGIEDERPTDPPPAPPTRVLADPPPPVPPAK